MQIDEKIEQEIKNAIKHDFHKLKGAKHKNDMKLSTSADADASKMSRPHITKKPVYADNVSNYRLSLYSGDLLYESGQGNRDNLCAKIRHNYDMNNTAETLYQRLISDTSLSQFNEAPDLPYTSLKYHTILTTNLHWNYLNNHKLSELRLKIVSLDEVNYIYDQIFKDERNKKCLIIADKELYPNHETVATIGSVPFTNFGDVISRMTGDVYLDRITFSNLRRIKSWSVGLQYLEDICRGSL
ncbi:MAG: hypothetical protein WC623_22165 [Pedobacter sp.]|uniref:hypothetical protein n=1 Tax=Pedobacter sp. TaxID=1411316 RepID=UPI003565137F